MLPTPATTIWSRSSALTGHGAAVANRRIFRQYGPTSFGLADLKRLANDLNRIDAQGATFVVSYAFCQEAVHLFEGWNMRRVTIQRNISGFAEHRRRAAEIIVSNIVRANLDA